MIVIKIEKGESLDKALKRYKYKVISTKQIEELRKRQEYVKNTVIKREKMKKAKYKQSLMNKFEN
jgi:small subunit ribosomal protein S21